MVVTMQLDIPQSTLSTAPGERALSPRCLLDDVQVCGRGEESRHGAPRPGPEKPALSLPAGVCPVGFTLLQKR